jgi:hypothetical protein
VADSPSREPVPLTWTMSPLRGQLPARQAGAGLHFVELETSSDATVREVGRHARLFALRPSLKDVRLAAPLERQEMLFSFSSETGGQKGFRRWIPFGRERRSTARVGALLGASGEAPPDYLIEAASRHGVDVSTRQWSVRIGGEFASQKVVFVLGTGSGGGPPNLVVKLTVWPELNSRLEAEHEALIRIQQVAGIDPDRAPRPIFIDRHAGRTLVAESHLAGDPFPRPRAGGAENAALKDAVAWLQQLAVATRDDVPPPAVAEALDTLLDRFEAAYRPDLELGRFLRRQIEAIRAAGRPFPAVMIHGDCGAWNLRVGADGRVLFLDWEAADPSGLPLWDVFHLFRSVAVLAPQGFLPRRRIERIRRHLVEDGPIGQDFAAAVRSHAEGLETLLIEPLFHLSWMHRALKEATRLRPSELAHGHYVRLLRMFAANRDRPNLRRVFGAS